MVYRPSSPWAWGFVGLSIVQAMIVLALESYVFAKFQLDIKNIHVPDKRQERTIPTYLTLFIFGFLYQIVLVWDALRLKNTIQVIGLCLYNLGLLIYAAVQEDQIKVALGPFGPGVQDRVEHSTRPVLVAVPCVIAFFTVALSFVAWKLYDEFAWTIYKHISADLRMKRRFLTYQIYIALLKFDFFFFLGFTVQFVVIFLPDNGGNTVELGLTIAAIPITIAILVLAAYWTRKEFKLGMAAIIALYFAGLAYFLYKMIRMYSPSKKEEYMYGRKALTTFAVITFILIVLTIINACVCTYNFDHGLKRHIAKRKVESEDEKAQMTDLPPYSYGSNYERTQLPSRMTID